MALLIPEIWHELVKTPKDQERPEGWILSTLSRHCLKHFRLPSSKTNNPFPTTTLLDLFKTHLQPEWNRGYVPEQMCSKFMHSEATGDAYRNTTTQRNRFRPPNDAIYTTVVVVNTPPNNGWWFPTELVHKDWEL